MKGLLLCGGNDSKLSSLTKKLPRHMLPVGNIPLAEYAINSMMQSGIHSIGIVTGESRGEFSGYFKDGRGLNCRIRYIQQRKPMGTANAVLCARDFLGDEDFVLAFGDVYFEENLSDHISLFKKDKLDALLLCSRVENPWQYGVVSVKDKRITRIVEKPAVTVSDLAACGVYIFRRSMLRAVSRIRPSRDDGSYSLSDAIQYLIDIKHNLSYGEMVRPWFHVDTGKKLLECSSLVSLRGEDKNCIAAGCEIISSSLGEGTAVGRRCSIKNATISNSIIMDDCIIDGIELYDSIVGGGCSISGTGRISGTFPEDTRLCLN